MSIINHARTTEIHTQRLFKFIIYGEHVINLRPDSFEKETIPNAVKNTIQNFKIFGPVRSRMQKNKAVVMCFLLIFIEVAYKVY